MYYAILISGLRWSNA